MSTISLTNVSSAPDPLATKTTGNSELGSDAFLNLLVTQLQYQDPLNPQKNEEFVAQLAQFTQVEQLTNANTALENMYTAIASMNNASMTQLLGKEVKAFGDEFHYEGEGEVELLFDAASETSGGTLTVSDENGKVVYTTDLSALEEGENSYSWDGTNHDGQSVGEGTYTFSVTATDSDGDEVEVQEIVHGEIDGMSFETGTPVPSIKGVDVSLGDIIHVGEGTDEATEEESNND